MIRSYWVIGRNPLRYKDLCARSIPLLRTVLHPRAYFLPTSETRVNRPFGLTQDHRTQDLTRRCCRIRIGLTIVISLDTSTTSTTNRPVTTTSGCTYRHRSHFTTLIPRVLLVKDAGRHNTRGIRSARDSQQSEFLDARDPWDMRMSQGSPS